MFWRKNVQKKKWKVISKPSPLLFSVWSSGTPLLTASFLLRTWRPSSPAQGVLYGVDTTEAHQGSLWVSMHSFKSHSTNITSTTNRYPDILWTMTMTENRTAKTKTAKTNTKLQKSCAPKPKPMSPEFRPNPWEPRTLKPGAHHTAGR